MLDFRLTTIGAERQCRVGVIDIGSNSIRLVVYEGVSRAPVPIFNEKVMCGLGRDLARTGRLHREGAALALTNLARFHRLLAGMAVDHVDILATAAVRDAADGPDFVADVERQAGLSVTTISGAEEARLSALGVLAGAPDADGVVGDLGGGSLELVGLQRTGMGEQVSLPLGPLRLMDEPGGRSGARQAVARHLAGQPWLAGYAGRAFYPVGGNWRALAKLLMEMKKHPLHIIHHYAAPAKDVMELARLVGSQGRHSLAELRGVSRRRLDTLPYAAMVLEGVLEALKPARVVFSAFGLREGHLYDLLPPAEQALDPLLVAAEDIARRVDRFGHAELIQLWTDGLWPDETPAALRLRRAACLLSDFCWAEHPDYRAEHAFYRTVRLPVPGIDHAERAFLGAALYARYGATPGDSVTAAVVALLDEASLRRATQLGLALRLGHTLTGGASGLLRTVHLRRQADHLVLDLPQSETVLVGDAVQRRLDALAKALGLAPRIETA